MIPACTQQDTLCVLYAHMCEVKLVARGGPNFVLREGDIKNLLWEGVKLFHLGWG